MMLSQITRVSKQLRVLQHKVQSLTDLLHALTMLRVGDYVMVTSTVCGRSKVQTGHVIRIHADALFIQVTDGSTEVIERFVDLQIISHPEEFRYSNSSSSEWSDIESDSN